MTRLKEGEVLANHRHVALVAVPKRSTILAFPDAVGDDVTNESSLLNCCLRHSGDGVTILGHRGSISRYKDVGRLGDIHEAADKCAPSAVRLGSQHFHHGRGADAGCP